MPKENTESSSAQAKPKERALFRGIFCLSKNQIHFPKIFPGLQDFLTENKSYAAKKTLKNDRQNVKTLVG